jgi:DNA topoisomerase-2
VGSSSLKGGIRWQIARCYASDGQVKSEGGSKGVKVSLKVADPKKPKKRVSGSKPSGARPVLSVEEALKQASEKKRKNGGLTIEEMYQKKTPIEHILLRPDTYIGSLVKTKQMQWVYHGAKGTVQQRECSYVPGLYKIFDEIIVNAADHKQRDPLNMTTVRVDIDVKRGIISVFNDGAGIPVQIHREENVYLPELLLGHLLTGSNFNDSIAKVTGGRNGYGAKLANIFSTEFTVETFDEATSLFYKQKWSQHMEVCNPAEVLQGRPVDEVPRGGAAVEVKSEKPIQLENSSFYYGQKGGFTRITFKPDLELFNMRKLGGDDIVTLMVRRVYDLAACLPGVKVFLDGAILPNNFSHLYSVNSKEELVMAEVNERWTVGIGANVEPSQLTQLSFVNCIHTLNGGTHVNYLADQVVKYVLERIKKRFKSLNVTASQVRNHLVIVVKCLIENPAFDSQTKERLMTKVENFGSTCVLDEKTLKEFVSKSGIVDFVTKQAEHLQKQALARTAHSSKRNKLAGIPKLDDANEAGGPKSKECTLIITEGDSAKTLAVSGLSVIGRDFYGVYPVQGKMLNVREAATPKVIENKEIKDLIQAIGLNPQRTYADWEKDAPTLRYGKVMLMADQDPDGSHIKGLFINFLHHFWPHLLKHNGFLFEFVTPLIKATKKSALSEDGGMEISSTSDGTSSNLTSESERPEKSENSPEKTPEKSSKPEKSVSFFTMVEYEKWKQTVDVRQWQVKYYKGLGTNTSAEAKQYFSNLKRHVVQFQWKNEADSLINMAFNKRFAAERRAWLLGYDPSDYVDTSRGHLDLVNFINKELIAFSAYDNMRSIPSVVDGLKPSQRKVLFSSFKRRLHAEIKVVQLAGYVSEQAGYHHGEQSLQGTIVNMAQNFVGANNLPLLVPSGQFGTRLQGGKDAASARYIFTRLSKYSRLIFPEDDDVLLKYLDDDGYPIEPEYYVPILPLLLVNGAEGVGTGWSTKVPSYNPLEIIANLKRLIQQQEMLPMQPWYRGFKGYTKPHRDGGFSTQGVFSRTPNGQLRIVELPIGRWTNDYKLFLEILVKEKRFVKEYSEYHTDELVSFVITPTAPEVLDSDKHIIERFKLEDLIHEKNMSAFGADGALKKYPTPLDVIKDFYPVRIKFYEARKSAKMNALRSLVTKLSTQSRFASAVIDGSIKLLNQPRQAVIEQLERQNFTKIENSYSFLLSTSLLHMTQEHIEKLKRETTEQQNALKVLEATPITEMWLSDLERLETAIRADPAFTEPPLTLGSKIKLPPLIATESPASRANASRTNAKQARRSAKSKKRAQSSSSSPSKRQKLVKLNPEDSL